MAGASKLIILLTTPFSILRPRPSLLRLARLSSSSLAPQSVSLHHLTNSPTSRPKLVFQLKASQQIHTQTSSLKEDNFGDSVGFSSPNHRASHPWPEWSKLVDTLSAGGYFDWQRFTAAEGHGIGVEDAFVAYEDLSEEFFHTARACLAFALHRSNLLGSLSRNDIEVVVDNGTPFLFKSALDTSRRMRSFLGSDGSKVLEFDKAHTVDLMKYLLSYASNTIVSSESNNLYNGVLVEPSVRNLLSQLAELSCRVSEPDLSASVQYQLPDRYGQTPRPLGQKIEMKRGDWICPRCNFMNFARNAKCLECEEARPKRQLNGGEWECPQCDFFNYGRNVVCLRCDCKRPGEASSSATNSRPGLGYKYGDHANKADVDSRLAANEEKAQRWFSKVSELGNASDLSKAATDEDFPEIMPLRKGVNRFVVSTRKTPLERRLANSQYQRNLGNDGTREDNHIQTGDPNKTIDTSISRSLDEILGRTSNVSDTDNKSTANGQITGTESSPPRFSSASPQYGHSKGSSSSYVPFVPLPADMFSKKTQNPKIEDSEKAVTGSIESVSLEAIEQTGSVSGSSDSGRPGDNFQLSEKSVSQAESQIRDKEQAEKSERWFKKVAELHDVTDLASAISDEDFPEIMPMRKGDNRFVVSKKKDRSLSSAIYKRRMAMEQAGNTNFVPFVPFPPDYFAKKDKQQSDGANSTGKATGEISSISAIPAKLAEKLDDAKPGGD
ncbi:hypothetical protein F0562_016192 [Nyssa sinensis]|uniref:RanBP2-type domain-containing protein n=1 Tax=Nyssa sinensis TaxID=561372 RepID=A0A5J4ZMK6_9ASTE|nr:hypothetical protein F0562_016192 [Nyssa sinensis]